MTTQTPHVSLSWRLLDQSLQVSLRGCQGSPARPNLTGNQPFLVLGDHGETVVVSSDPTRIPHSDESSAGELWRGLALDHPGVSLPARTLARLCTAMDAAAVPVALASLPGKTLLLFPASLAGRALAALHQAGIDRITI